MPPSSTCSPYCSGWRTRNKFQFRPSLFLFSTSAEKYSDWCTSRGEVEGVSLKNFPPRPRHRRRKTPCLVVFRVFTNMYFLSGAERIKTPQLSRRKQTPESESGERSCGVRSQLPALPWGKTRLWVLIPRHRRASLKYCCHAAITGSHWWYTNSPLAKLLKAH